MTFGERLKSLRASRGWPRLQLTMRTGVDPQLIGKHEKGECDPSWSSMVSYAAAFEMTMSELLDGVASRSQTSRSSGEAV